MFEWKRTAALAPIALSLGFLGALPGSALADGDADIGAKIFRRCQACHTVNEGQHRVGPSLFGVIGRKAGSVEGFTRYSDAMTSSGITWTEDTLSAYLENPREYIPGNKMAFPGLRKEEDRDNVIAFIERASDKDDD
ncbi:cytochrome c [Iodidimonas gelatinilytica]|uniref:Cytochrome c n=1 Tax=Iodidimonas gelatinilytica TaxID=1236966 RepID=A0A5A7MPG9_9PROT|nr:cytochrome c family protein [Iodidimonas gelatinilytica]GEQ97930.1 cytochrome c [Iodidimonas gelatinilytica]GEQ99949.1 cytochrome c [Iodidimonas gelatinilytica]